MGRFIITSLILIGLFSIGCNNKEADIKHEEEIKIVNDRLQQAESLLEEMKDAKGNVAKATNYGVEIMGIYAAWKTSPASDSLINMMSQCSADRLALVVKLERASRKAVNQATNLPSDKAEEKVKWLIEGVDGFVTIMQQFSTKQNICQPINGSTQTA